jgi:hypothetical protein
LVVRRGQVGTLPDYELSNTNDAQIEVIATFMSRLDLLDRLIASSSGIDLGGNEVQSYAEWRHHVVQALLPRTYFQAIKTSFAFKHVVP